VRFTGGTRLDASDGFVKRCLWHRAGADQSSKMRLEGIAVHIHVESGNSAFWAADVSSSATP
jgi:hypothetical protein